MDDTSSTNPVSTQATRDYSTQYSTNDLPKTDLGKDDFLKLLLTELQHQDIMNAGDNKEFISQMAQFTSLEQMENIATSLQSLASAQLMTQSSSLLGKVIQGVDKSSQEAIIAKVTEVEFHDGSVTVTAGGKQIDMKDISRILEPSSLVGKLIEGQPEGEDAVVAGKVAEVSTEGNDVVLIVDGKKVKVDDVSRILDPASIINQLVEGKLEDSDEVVTGRVTDVTTDGQHIVLLLDDRRIRASDVTKVYGPAAA